MNSQVLKGSLLIAAAACCYGLLGTFVKMAYYAGYNTAEVTISQFVLGLLGLLLINWIGRKSRAGQTENKIAAKSLVRMAGSGVSLGLTSIFYYMAVKYIAVGIAIVLLLQAVWMSMVLDSLLKKNRPGLLQSGAVVVILTGTVLATGTGWGGGHFSLQGIIWGLLAACAYTATMYSSNNVETWLPPLKRSLLMIAGGLVVVVLVFLPSVFHGFSLKIFLSWALPVSLFGTILPPILFTRGMPLTGMGLGAILTSLEVPVSITFAHVMLGENTTRLQWFGVALILFAVVLINLKQLKGIKSNLEKAS